MPFWVVAIVSAFPLMQMPVEVKERSSPTIVGSVIFFPTHAWLSQDQKQVADNCLFGGGMTGKLPSNSSHQELIPLGTGVQAHGCLDFYCANKRQDRRVLQIQGKPHTADALQVSVQQEVSLARIQLLFSLTDASWLDR
jgi:hypothetical protein